MFQRHFLISFFIFFATLLSAQNETKIKISTEFGDMIAILYDDTPVHKENFLNNIKNGVYDGSLFHRVIPAFMAQGGNPDSKTATPEQGLSADTCPQLEAEIRRNHFHKKGALSAARLPDAVNPTRKSSSCQFFVVQGYQHTDAQLNAMENDNYKFPDINRAIYKVRGGSPFLDMQYTVFGEVIEGLEIIDMIHAMPSGGNFFCLPKKNETKKRAPFAKKFFFPSSRKPE